MKCYFYPHEKPQWLKEHECADHLLADNAHGVIAAVYISPDYRDTAERNNLVKQLSEMLSQARQKKAKNDTRNT